MAAFVRAVRYRLDISRHIFACFNVSRNAKHLCPDISLSHRLSRPCSSQIASNPQVIVKKVPTSKDTALHDMISGNIIGKGGWKIQKLLQPFLHCKLLVKDDHISIYGFDSEVVKTVEEMVTVLVQRYKAEGQFDYTATVSTDDDIDVHTWICFQIRHCFNTEPNIVIDQTERDHLIVSGLDDEVMKEAVQKVILEIQRIKRDIALPVRETVLTDEDPDIHYMICSNFAKDGYRRVKELMSETGLDFRLFTKKPDSILVSGFDTEVVNIAAKRVSVEVQTIRNELSQYPFIKKVTTDQEYDVHENTCERLFTKGLEGVRRFEFENGPDLKIQISKQGYLFVTGSDAKVVQKAAALLQLKVKGIKHAFPHFPIEEKVWTHDDVDMHHYISRHFMKEGGETMRKFKLETGLDFEIDERTHTNKYNSGMTGYILVKGFDAEVVRKAAQKVTEEMERVKNEVCLPFMQKVLLDINAHISEQICWFLIEQNERKLMLETELNCKLSVTKSHRHLLICASDAETMKSAVQIVTQEISKIKRFKIRPYQGEVLTDDDPYIHGKICSMLLVNHSEKIERIKMKAKINFDIKWKNTGLILIFGSHPQVVNAARLHIKEEVRKFKDLMKKKNYQKIC